MVAGDVKCYHCGYISGEVVSESASAPRPSLFRPAKDYPRPLPRPGEALRCGRCGGPVFVDEVRVVRHRPPEPVQKRRRRGRWPKKLAKAG